MSGATASTFAVAPFARIGTSPDRGAVDADFLHRLLNPDPAARLLEWLDDPAAFRSRADAAQLRSLERLSARYTAARRCRSRGWRACSGRTRAHDDGAVFRFVENACRRFVDR
jgi:hypothetical protein